MWTQKLKEIGIFDVMCSGKAVSHLLLLDASREGIGGRNSLSALYHVTISADG